MFFKFFKAQNYVNYKAIARKFALNSSVTIVSFYFISNNIIDVTWCVGPSMMPTINEKGQFVLVDIISYKYLGKKYKAGNIVISKCPTDTEKSNDMYYSIYRR